MMDLVGKVIGRLTILEHLGRINKRHMYRCICNCGTEKTIYRSSLIGNKAKSCGCLNRELASERMKKVQKLTHTHDMSKTRFYKSWLSMHARCTNPDTNGYKNYGGRGIKVCDEWKKFEQFQEDMFKSYTSHAAEYGEKNTTLDRTDVNGNYSKDNCQWKTISYQCRNKRSTRKFVFDGETTDLLTLCERHGMRYDTVRFRLKSGWTLEAALTTPPETRFIKWMNRRTL